jgi:hypothetical protein
VKYSKIYTAKISKYFIPGTRQPIEIDPFCQLLRGQAIYGDDFQQDEIDAWFYDEAEGYANLGAKNLDTYEYPYHAMNRIYGFNLIPSSRWRS